MKLARIVVKTIWFIYYLVRFRDVQLAYDFAHYHISPNATSLLKREGNMLTFSRTQNNIPLKQTYLYKQELRSLISVLNTKGIQVVDYKTSKHTVLQIEGVVVNVLSLSNMVTVKEMYLERLYDLRTPRGTNVIVDIGMNVGYASLFFASAKNTEHVYSFEPFPETYNEAIANFELNPNLKTKISPTNVGISDTTKEVVVPMLESGSAIASTSPLFKEHNQALSTKTVTVQVRGIVETLDEVASKHPDNNLIVKVDCEGEEYAIMKALDGGHLIKNVASFFIEWHMHGSAPIIEVLTRNGFMALNLPREGVDSGMIYAFRA